MAGTFVKINPDGTVIKERTELKGSAPYDPLRRLVGNSVERVQVRYENRIRDCYVDEEGGLPHRNLPINPHIMALLNDTWRGAGIRGPGVIWVPDPRVKK
jgi:hypothetical protein